MKTLYLYIIALLCFSCNMDKLNEDSSFKKSKTVFTKGSYDSKKDIDVSLNLLTDSNKVQISISGLFGISQLTKELTESNIPIFDIKQKVRFNAGHYTMNASIDGHVIDRATLLIHPKSIKGKSTNYVGPKTTSFNDQQGSMITGYFQDEHLNLVDTTLTLTYQIQSTTTKEIQNVSTDHDYYFKKIIPSKNNTRQLVGVSAGKEYSEEIIVIGSSGCPMSASMLILDRYNIADGHQIFTVDVNDIKDVDGADVKDGNDVALVIESENYKSQYGGVIINGSAKFIVLNPNIPGNYSISIISCNQIITQEKDLYFRPALQTIPYLVNAEELIVGPLLSQLNQSIPDGSLVELQSTHCPQRKVLSTQTKNGLAKFDIEEVKRDCQSSLYTISINGVSSELLLTNKNNNDS